MGNADNYEVDGRLKIRKIVERIVRKVSKDIISSLKSECGSEIKGWEVIDCANVILFEFALAAMNGFVCINSVDNSADDLNQLVAETLRVNSLAFTELFQLMGRGELFETSETKSPFDCFFDPNYKQGNPENN